MTNTAIRDNTDNKDIVVLGGTGKTGRRVVERLRARDLPVRVASRPGFDWNDRDTWEPTLAGAGAAYLTYYPDLAVPGAAETVTTLAKLAVENGVDRLVLLSGRGEAEAARAEQGVRASGGEVTVVRASWFNQNFSEGEFAGFVLAGEIVLPAGAVAEPFVDADDIADVAVAALTEPGHAGEIYEVTGPRLLTFTEVAAEISAASGREVRYRAVSPEEFAAHQTEIGVPAEFVGMLVALFAEVLDGHNAYLTDGVQRALGRPPRDFADYAAAAAAAGAWEQP